MLICRKRANFGKKCLKLLRILIFLNTKNTGSFLPNFTASFCHPIKSSENRDRYSCRLF